MKYEWIGKRYGCEGILKIYPIDCLDRVAIHVTYLCTGDVSIGVEGSPEMWGSRAAEQWAVGMLAASRILLDFQELGFEAAKEEDVVDRRIAEAERIVWD